MFEHRIWNVRSRFICALLVIWLVGVYCVGILFPSISAWVIYLLMILGGFILGAWLFIANRWRFVKGVVKEVGPSAWIRRLFTIEFVVEP